MKGLRLLVALVITVCGASRLTEGGPLNGTARRQLAADTPVVTINAGLGSWSPPFEPHIMGGYRSEERGYWAQIYNPARTLQPLQMVSNRFQISLRDVELEEDGTFSDGPDKTQLGIIQKIAASVSSDIFITVGYPWTIKSRSYIQKDFPPGWEAYWERTYTTLADTLASQPYWTGKPVWVELMGEPDFALWSWVYGKDRQRIFKVIKMAHDAFARHRDKFRIGGCGFALPGSAWVGAFLDFYTASGMQFDFMSFHHYLGWTDATNPATYPGGSAALNLGYRNGVFHDMLAAKGLGGMPVVVSEYAWQDPSVTGAAGFGDQAKSARYTLTRWHSCARTLQAINIVMEERDIARAYWAQGVGRVASGGGHLNKYAYDPFVVYDQSKGNWRYKASYYAFWMYGKMKGARVEAASRDPALGVWASKEDYAIKVAIWNRSNVARSARLALSGVQDTWPCVMYRVDDITFKVSAGGLDAVISGPTSPIPPVEASVRTVKGALTFLQTRQLRPEATIFLSITIQ